MHRLPAPSTVIRFRFAACLFWSIWLIAAGSAGTLGYSVWLHDSTLTMAGLALGGLALAMILIQRIVAIRAHCPLCLVPPLVGKRCSKHRKARRLFGSHRFRVATSILFLDHFRCPFCGEPTAMEARKPHPAESCASRH